MSHVETQENRTSKVIFGLLADDPSKISYRPAFARLTGSVTAAILLQQMLYWWKACGQQAFFKFKEPCEHKAYKPGDSWCEELAFSRSEFDTALKKIGTKVTKKRLGAALKWEWPKEEDWVDNPGGYQEAIKKSVQHIVLYWTDGGRKTWYAINTDLLAKATFLLYRAKVEIPLYLSKEGIPLYHSSETNTETNNTEESFTDVQDSSSAKPSVKTSSVNLKAVAINLRNEMPDLVSGTIQEQPVGGPLPDGYLPLYEWDIPDHQECGLIHKALYGTCGEQGAVCGYQHAASTEKEPGTRYIECVGCFEWNLKTESAQVKRLAASIQEASAGSITLPPGQPGGPYVELIGPPKTPRKQNVPRQPMVFKGSTYYGPAPDYETAKRWSAGEGTITDLAAVPPGSPVAPWPDGAGSLPHVQKIWDWMLAVGKDVTPSTIKVKPFVALGKAWLEGNEDMTCAGVLYRAWIDAQPGKPTLTWTVGEVTVATRQALALCKAGITAQDVKAFVKEKREETDPRTGKRFWNGKLMPFEFVANHITSWKADANPPVPKMRRINYPDGSYLEVPE